MILSREEQRNPFLAIKDPRLDSNPLGTLRDSTARRAGYPRRLEVESTRAPRDMV